ncbi:hypothetical protein [Candidatus Thiosymbion oneisti]|nr:hypothetical protein [Candidatus Thiosymbion oneisti]
MANNRKLHSPEFKAKVSRDAIQGMKTTMIYTHVLNRGGRGVISPLESLA